jgi:hypothetical protein
MNRRCLSLTVLITVLVMLVVEASRTKIDSTTTSIVGTDWVPLNSHPGATAVEIINTTGVQINIRQTGTTVNGITINDKDALTLFPSSDTKEFQVQRTDHSNTPVTVGWKFE